MSKPKSLRLLAVIEAREVTAPAKALLEFCSTESAQAYADGPEVHVVTFHRGEPARDDREVPFHKAVRDAGIELDVITERYRFDPTVLSRLGQVAMYRNPDILQTNGVKSHFLVRAAGLNKRIPWVAHHHGYTAEDLKMRAYNQLDRWSLPAADRVVTGCASFARSLARRGVDPERITVVPNAIRESLPATEHEVAALRGEFGLHPGVRAIVSVGRLSREKGHMDLILAAKHLLKRRPELPFRIVIVGEGPERGRLESAVQTLQLEGRVMLAGYRHRVGPFYRLADLFALPSHSEGTAQVLLEAMAAGTPIVATAVGGIPLAVKNRESALVVPPRRPADLADAADRILNDAELASRLAGNAKRDVDAQFTVEANGKALRAIYRGLLSGPA